MEDRDTSRTGHFVLAVLGGALAGAALGLLLAPTSGRDARRRIVDQVELARATVFRVPAAFRSATHAAKDTLLGSSGHNGRSSRHA